MANSAHFANELMARKYSLVSGGTDNHLVLVDLKTSRGVDGARVERVLELANIATNKNTIPGDTSALQPGGIRMGAPALTSRGLVEADFSKVAEFFDRGVEIACSLKNSPAGAKLKDFRATLADDVWQTNSPELAQLRSDVVSFSRSFPTVGFDESELEGAQAA